MADNVGVDPSASYTVAADVLGTIAYQRVKVQVGSDGTVGDVDATNPLPITGTVVVSVSVAVSTEVSGTVSVSGPVQISGVVSISVMPAVSGTVTVNVSGVVPVTTAASVSVAGIPVWMNPTQAVVVNTIGAGFSVNALVTGVVSVSVLPAVSISVSAALGTVITILGTQVVTVVPGLSVSAVVSGTVAISIPVSQALGTIITILGTQIVSVVPGLSVSAVVSGTVAISIPVSQALGTVITILGTQVVTVVPGLSVSALVSVSAMAASLTLGTVVTLLGTVMVQPNFSTTATPSAAGTGQIIWVANTGAIMTTTAVSGSTGPVVWLGASQTLSPNAGLPLLIMVTSTAGAISMTTYLFTMWTGGIVAGAGLTQFAVPSGKRFRIMNIQAVINSSAVTGGTVMVAVIGATASASLTSGSVPTQPWFRALQVLVSAGPIMANIGDAAGGDIVAGTTFAVCAQGSTAYQIGGIVIQGNIF